MLHELIAANRCEILAQALTRAVERGPSDKTADPLAHGLLVFLDQLCEVLRKVALRDVVDHAKITTSAGQHGDDLFHQGLTVGQVINGYGDLCQVITGLAVDQSASISAGEFRTLNLCLDDATAGAVTAYAGQRERAIRDEGTERLGFLAHELRNALGAATLAFGSIKAGVVAIGGSTSAIVDRSHMRLQSLIDRSLADVRLESGTLNLERVSLWEIVEEAEISGALIAQTKGLHFAVAAVDRDVVVEADRPILAATIANLLQNAFKFTHPGTTVSLRVGTTTHRVLIEIQDECGGLPEGAAENLLRPFVQLGRDRTGLGLGLSICLKAVKTMAGELHIRDLPGEGCIFTIDLPRQPPPPTSIHARRETGTEGHAGSGGKNAPSR